MSHRVQSIRPAGAGKPRLCAKCDKEVILLPGAQRWTHK